MFTPQEIQEKTFVKAVFGGYDMQTVDDFLEPLTADYITLYKENAVLKSKMKVLVEKLEEYRAQEQSMRKAIVSAQRTADAMVAEAEKKCARIMNDAEHAASEKTADPEAVAKKTESVTREADEIVRQEEERMDYAKKTALNFINVLEQDIRGHLDLLERLKKEDLGVSQKKEPKRAKAFDYEEEEHPLVVPKQDEQPLVVPKEPEEKSETPEEIANEIEQSITRLMDMEEPVKDDGSMDSTIKFTNLQFGRNYDPTSK